MSKIRHGRPTREPSSTPQHLKLPEATPSRAASLRHFAPGAIVQRALAAPHSLRPADLMAMQRTLGNRAVGAMLGRAPVQPNRDRDVFRIDRKEHGLGKGSGRPLPEAVRGEMEAALGADFSAVRVHVGLQAERIGAIAFTIGSDIYFAPGRFQPDAAHGQQLLGHELAHVVQQRQGRVHDPSGVGVAVVQDRALEAEAERVGYRAASSRAKAAPAAAAAERRMPDDVALGQRQVIAGLPTRSPSHLPLQMQPTKKQIKNVLTLGIRKAYVKHKRAVRAAAAALAAQQQQNHEQIYHSAVKYHSTSPRNVPSIVEHGLLNQRDRMATFGQDISGLSKSYRESPFRGDEKKGVFFGGHAFALENKGYLSDARVRMILPVDRNIEPEDPYAEPRNRDDLGHFFDINFPGAGGGGRYTPVSIGPKYIWSGKFTSLTMEKKRVICEVIREYYPDPKPSWKEVLQIHLQAINDEEISDDALDNAHRYI
jgi:hypothetical protein